MQSYEYRKFDYNLDSEGNKTELWNPIDTEFQ